jgi:transcription initiation factor TFIID subunit 1
VVTKSYPDGRVEKIEDDVAADVGEAWMKHRKFKPDGSVDVAASRDAVMKILYPHGVDPPAYVSGGSVGGGGAGGMGAGGDASLNRTIKAPNFQGTADQKADLLRLRKRKMELLRRRKKKAEQLRAEAGLSQQDLAAMAEKAEKAESAEGGAPKKLKIALSFKLGGAASAGAGPSRFAPKEETPLTKPTTSRFRATSSRDDVLCQIAEGLASVPAYAAFAVPVTKKALPDYHKFVSRKMDLGTIARAAKRAGGYESVDAWMRDVRQILTNARLYHEADEDVLIRVPAIVHAAEALVRDAETALEARANDIAQFDNAFDLEKVLGRTTNASEAE